jgi:hypothetical protein
VYRGAPAAACLACSLLTEASPVGGPLVISRNRETSHDATSVNAEKYCSISSSGRALQWSQVWGLGGVCGVSVQSGWLCGR